MECLMMKRVLISMALLMSFAQTVIGEPTEFSSFYEKPYAAVRQALLEDGWHVVPNTDINNSSMVAQAIHEKQYQEVLDCISMERDQCQFQLAKGKQVIVVTTKEKTFNVESIKPMHTDSHD
jgi:hypothetical protein